MIWQYIVESVSHSFALVFFGFGKVDKRDTSSKLFVYQVLLLLEPHAHSFNMLRNQKLDRPAVPIVVAKL